MKLRDKLFLTAALATLIPLTGYLLFDLFVTRERLMRDAAAGLHMSAEALASGLADCAPPCEERARSLVETFSATYPDVQLFVVDRDLAVIAASTDEVTLTPDQEPGLLAVLAGTLSRDERFMSHAGIPVLDVSVPWRLSPDGAPVGGVHIARTLSSVSEQVGSTRLRHLVFVGAVALLVALSLSLAVYRLVVRRVLSLQRELQESTPPSDTPPRQGSGDELEFATAAIRSLALRQAATAAELQGTLAEREQLLAEVEDFNARLRVEVDKATAGLRAAHRQLDRAERVATLGQLAAGLAHDIRNPLFIVRATAQSIARRAPEQQERVQDIVGEVDRVESIIAQLLDLSRPLDVSQRPIAAEEVVEVVLNRARRAEAARGGGIQFTRAGQEGLSFCGDPTYLAQALGNIVDNAQEVLGDDGTVGIDVGRTEDGFVELCVWDDGPGMAEEDIPHLFEPFFSRKAAGTGLGLCASQKIVELHGGTIDAATRPEGGACFRIKLPLSCPAPMESQCPRSSSSTTNGKYAACSESCSRTSAGT